MAPRKTTAVTTPPPRKRAPRKAVKKASATPQFTRVDVGDEEPKWERQEIPRHPQWNGPLVIPLQHNAKPGSRKCNLCGRRWNGKCPCVYYKRTTTFIDVLSDQTALKAWDRRLVATGMAENPELVLSALAIRNDRDLSQTAEDKKALQKVADEAKEKAGGTTKAKVGTSLHTLTQWMDEGKELGYVPEPYPADLDAYAQCTKGIEWTNIESFRVHDEWKVAGTTDRIGWYRGRLTIFDVKTGGLYFKAGPAMQLAMYARSTPYDIATDTRASDADELRLDVGYVIHLPAGSGHCELMPVNIENGWAACQLAKAVWDTRKQADADWFPNEDRYAEVYEMATRATSLKECKMLWANARDMGLLDANLKGVLTVRAKEVSE